MSNDDQLEVAGTVWDSLSTGKKIGLFIMLAGLVVGAFWAGYKVADIRHSNEIAAIQAQHSRQLATQSIPESQPQFRIGLLPPDAGLPTYNDAEPSELSMSEIAAERERQTEANQSLTSVHQKPILENYVGKRFEWSGYVSDVSRSIFDAVPYYTVSFKPYLDSQVEYKAYFVGDQYEEMTKALVPSQEVVISGVLNDRGSLTQCKFVRIHDPAE